MFDANNSLTSRLWYRSKSTPKRIAFRYVDFGSHHEETITYFELKHHVEVLASHLAAHYQPGERVVLFYPTGLEFVVAILGCMNAGVVAVPVGSPNSPNGVDSTSGQDWFSTIVLASQATAVLTTGELKPIIGDRFNNMGEQFKNVDIIDANSAAPASVKSSFVARPDSVFLEQFVSVMDGQSNSHSMTHCELAEQMETLRAKLKLNGESSILGCLPISHSPGLIAQVLLPIYAGCTSNLMSHFDAIRDPATWLTAISSFGATTVGAPEVVFELGASPLPIQELSRLDFNRWDSAFSGSEPVAPVTQEAFSNQFAQRGFDKAAFCATSFQDHSDSSAIPSPIPHVTMRPSQSSPSQMT
jgi:acyl-CoA synthetase (AMP-forming)/AMP-acid ligase II